MIRRERIEEKRELRGGTGSVFFHHLLEIFFSFELSLDFYEAFSVVSLLSFILINYFISSFISIGIISNSFKCLLFYSVKIKIYLL